MKNLVMLYKFPGPHLLEDGSYDWLTVDANSDGELESALADGWRKTLEEAKSLEKDDSPTRAELEQKASELALKFDGRTSYAKLVKMIEEAIRVVD